MILVIPLMDSTLLVDLVLVNKLLAPSPALASSFPVLVQMIVVGGVIFSPRVD